MCAITAYVRLAEFTRTHQIHFHGSRAAAAWENPFNGWAQHRPHAGQSHKADLLGPWRQQQPAVVVGEVRRPCTPALAQTPRLRADATAPYLATAAGPPILCRRYYCEAHGLLFVVDASDAMRLDESREVLRQLLDNPELAGIPVLVMANKQDAPGAITPHEVQARFGLQRDGGSSQPQNVLGVTAINGDGVEEGIHWLVDAVSSSPRALALAGKSWGQ